jgi:hypothetical protein
MHHFVYLSKVDCLFPFELDYFDSVLFFPSIDVDT